MSTTARDPALDAAGWDADDYYAVLGLPHDATRDEIRSAFRRLAMRWHPDHFVATAEDEHEHASQRMRALLRAHQVLSDPVRRREYDRACATGQPYVEGHVYEVRTTPQAPVYHRHTPSSGDQYEPPVYRHAARTPEPLRYGHGNTNPVGILFGILTSILAIAVLGRIVSEGVSSLFGAFLAFLVLLGLVALAALFFSEDSPITRAARDFVEAEPANLHDHAPAHPHQRPGYYHVPHTDTEPTEFERLVDQALATLPIEFQSYLENVVVHVKDEPSDDELRRMKLRPCSLLLGLYEGVPLIHQSVYGAGPEVVTIFQRPIEEYCGGDPERIRQQVRATVLHELAHHFGIDHEDMPDWIK